MAFEPLFSNRIVTIVEPPQIKASGDVLVCGKEVCIEGDEKNVKLSATYITATHTVPGTGFVTIKSLDANQISAVCKNQKSLIVVGKGSFFIASFSPSTPAMLPPPISSPDTVAPSYGKGKFIQSQDTVRA
ncbi:hypothetical protein [Aeromonas sp. SG16]|uniref:hypothetical protein n=1 Tax=Aeromonas sp. SG16 TaxID=2950548 RepID=UPI00210EDC12|nr:hypothetical protein [Aeromonas sp. SG16]MCQ4054444.1 hypothetical protein [Aeromonas sp. SG16]